MNAVFKQFFKHKSDDKCNRNDDNWIGKFNDRTFSIESIVILFRQVQKHELL
jgi:hypothetical protein